MNEWQTIVLFYAALHYLQAYFSAKTRHYPMTHQERDQIIPADVKLRSIYNHFYQLCTGGEEKFHHQPHGQLRFGEDGANGAAGTVEGQAADHRKGNDAHQAHARLFQQQDQHLTYVAHSHASGALPF